MPGLGVFSFSKDVAACFLKVVGLSVICFPKHGAMTQRASPRQLSFGERMSRTLPAELTWNRTLGPGPGAPLKRQNGLNQDPPNVRFPERQLRPPVAPFLLAAIRMEEVGMTRFWEFPNTGNHQSDGLQGSFPHFLLSTSKSSSLSQSGE